ncbi:MAG: cytochrome P450 [Proteobacteria bacterium]|nr:cytochrome P450 [Pseudomonadota bacterium]
MKNDLQDKAREYRLGWLHGLDSFRDGTRAERQPAPGPQPGLLATTYDSTCRLLKHPALRADRYPGPELQTLGESERAANALRRELEAGRFVKRQDSRESQARAIVAYVCGRAVAASMRPFIERCASALLASRREKLDLVADYAAVLPDYVLCHMLAMPVSDRPRLRHWADELSRVADGETHAVLTASAAAHDIRRFIVARYAELGNRGDAADGRGVLVRRLDAYPEDVVTSAVAVMLAAGNETVQDLIGSAAVVLLANPDIEARVRSSPNLARPLVEEVLRLETPVQSTDRVASESTTVGRCPMRKWERATVWLAAANRDRAVFRDANEVRLDRRTNPHLAFGLGANKCPAAALARLEAQIAIRRLLRHTDALRLAAPIVRKPEGVLRGLRSLTIALP